MILGINHKSSKEAENNDQNQSDHIDEKCSMVKQIRFTRIIF